MKIHDMIGVVILIIIMLIGASIIMILTMIIIIGSSIILLLIIIISSSIVITMNIVDGRYIQLHVHMHHLCLCLRVWGGRGSGPIAATNNWAMLVRTMTPLSCPFLSCIVCSIPMLFRFNHALNGFAKKNTVPPCRQKKNLNGTSKYIAIQCLLLLWPSKWRPTWHSNHQLSCQGAVGRLWHLGCFGFRLAMAIDTDRETRLIDCWCITI